jgi:phage terminase small subunit
MARLTAKQKRFANEYIIDLNATQAAIRAGYTSKYANTNANKLLQNTTLAEYIQGLMDERSRRTLVTQDKVVNELANIAFADISSFLKVENNQVEVFDTDSIQHEMLAAIAEIKEGNYGISIKLHDKLKALELLGRHLGMFKDKVEVTADVNNPFEGFTTEELKALINSD